MLGPEWSAAAEAIIEESLMRLKLCANKARILGSKLMTDNFLENVMIQKLDHRLNIYSFRPVSCHDAVELCRRCSPAEQHRSWLHACVEQPITECDAVSKSAMLLFSRNA